MRIRMFTVPNLITLGSLACGSSAVVYALAPGGLRTAFWLIIAAAVLDFCDGLAARMLRSVSEIGKQLDSLSDMVSFGLAPGAILYAMFTSSGGSPLAGLTVFSITLFSALRLARFNIDDRQTDSFIGLPTPAAAIFIAACGWLYATGAITPPPIVTVCTALVLGLLEILPLPMFSLKFKSFAVKDNLVRYCFLAVSVIMIALLGMGALPLVIILYILLSACLYFCCNSHKIKS